MDRQTVSLTRQGKLLGPSVKRTISEDCTRVSESEQAAGKFQCLRKEARRHSRQPHLSLVTEGDAHRHHPLKRAPAPARKHLDGSQGAAANSTTTPLIPPQNEQPLVQPQQGQMLESSPQMNQQQATAAMGMTPTTPFGHHHFPTHGIQSYDMVVQQTPQWQTTCYVGNLTPYTTQNDIVPLFQNFGYIIESRMQADRGFAFIKMDSHENAAMAICQLNGYNVNGRPLKCNWGKDFYRPV